MGAMPVVFDISSDEEPVLEEGVKGSDFDWIKGLLGMSDEENSDDSDDVVVVREVKPKSKSKSSMPAVRAVDEGDDDDCVVLDGDPEKHSTSAVEEANGSDEVVIVGEKGPIACRDYPHARHLCAKFPFSSTPHERHCEQCHCYVCDTLAPCLMWGTGISSTDHCHAHDKTETWKTERKNFKLGRSASFPASNHGTSFHVRHPQSNQIRPLDIIPLSPNSVVQNQPSRPNVVRTYSSLNPITENQASRPTVMHAACLPSQNPSLQNQVSRPINVPACSTATNLTIPDGTNCDVHQDPGFTLVRNRYHPHSAPRQLLGVRNHAIQKERGAGASSLGPHLVHNMTGNYSVHGSSGFINEVNLAQQYDKFCTATEFSNDRNCNNMTGNHSVHGSSGFINQVNLARQYDKYCTATEFSNDGNCNRLNDVWLSNHLPSCPHPSSEPVSLSNGTQAHSQPLSQANDSQGFYESCIQGNDAPSSYVACPSSSQRINEPQITSQNEDTAGNSTECEIVGQNTHQQKPQEESQSETARKADFSTSDSSWTENTSKSGAQFTGTAGLGSFADIENWILGQGPIPGVNDSATASISEMNIPSPDFGPIDTGLLLFDFENPWNGIAHA